MSITPLPAKNMSTFRSGLMTLGFLQEVFLKQVNKHDLLHLKSSSEIQK